jgi:hypothetical protein
MSRACNTQRQKKDACSILMRKPEEKRLLGRHRRKLEGNIKMYVGELEWDSMDWINLA